jgi:protein phosphatase
MKINFAVISKTGRRSKNEGYVKVIDKPEELRWLGVVCDGMGGHENGEVASATVCESLGEFLENHQPEDGIMTPDMFKQALEYAYNELDKKDAGGLKKMGTTMTCLYLHKKGYLVAHIGDSRIYHIRPNTGIVYQSSDHSLVNDLLRAGELTEEEAINFPQKNVITRAMQPNLERRHKADIYSFNDIQKGDYFFLCCDGVLEQLTNDKLCEILLDKNSSDIQKLDAIKQVCDGKTKDNYTCYFIPIDDVVLEKDDKEDKSVDIIDGIQLEGEPSKVTCIIPIKKINNLPDNRSFSDLGKKRKMKWWYWVLLLLLLSIGGIIWELNLNKSESEADTEISENSFLESLKNIFIVEKDSIVQDTLLKEPILEFDMEER